MSGRVPAVTPVGAVGTGDLVVTPVGVVERLVDLLRRERTALARLDKHELQSIADGGNTLLRSLHTYLGPNAPSISPEDQQRFADAVRKLVIEAQINAVLTHDARTALAEMLGEPTSEGTYNARGELSRAVRAIVRGRI